VRAIVLAGGEGTRLRPLTWRTPKPLAPILNRPLLAHLLGHLQSHGVDRVTMAMTRRSEAIENALRGGMVPGLDISFVYEETPLGSGGAIAQAAAGWHEPFLVCNGDLITDLDVTSMIAAHRERGARLSIALHRVASPWAFGVVELAEGDRISRFVEKPAAGTEPSNLINAGTWIFEPSLVQEMDATRFNRVEDELFPALAGRGAAIYGFHRPGGYWMDVGNPEAYRQVNLDLVGGAIPSRLPADWPANRLGVAEATVDFAAIAEPPVLLGSGTTVEPRAVLRGPVVTGANCAIEAGAVVEESVLWDDVTIGPGAIVRRSVLATGAVVEPGAVLDSAVIAHGATIPAGVHAPVGLRVEPGVRYALDATETAQAGT